jgi:hypothetical protein
MFVLWLYQSAIASYKQNVGARRIRCIGYKERKDISCESRWMYFIIIITSNIVGLHVVEYWLRQYVIYRKVAGLRPY